MRKPRLKARDNQDNAFYHCISRVVDRQFLLGDSEKEHFLSLMWEYAEFCGVRIVAYCLMSNHFHLLVQVPSRPKQSLSDDELLSHLDKLSGLSQADTIRQRLGWFREQGHHAAAEELRESVMARMWDVSAFMKLLKQRFTRWYNRQHNRKGTLWEERFKSVLIESAGPTLATIAAYIDLNPVRANIAESPESYRWCSYGAAMGGLARARDGYAEIFRGYANGARDVMETYRRWLYGQGEETEGVTETGAPVRKGIPREQVVEIMRVKGRVNLGDYLRCRVRYFADGMVLGSQGFVDGVFESSRDRFGPKRKNGARRLAGVDHLIYSMRDLQVQRVT